MKLSCLVLVLSMLVIVSAEDEICEKMKLDAKLMCSHCKNEDVKKDLDNYSECVKKLYPKEVEDTDKIRKETENDPALCQQKILEYIGKYKKENAEGWNKVYDCYKQNVKEGDVDKC